MFNKKIKIENNSVVFLFINGPHHTHHLILPALTFAHNYKQYQTTLISGSDKNTEIIEQTLDKMGNPGCKIIKLPKPGSRYADTGNEIRRKKKNEIKTGIHLA